MKSSYQEAARALRSAYRAGPIEPLRAWLDPDDLEGAYQVQAIDRGERVTGGSRVVGRKIGLTGALARTALNAKEPDSGILYDDMHIADGGTLDAFKTIDPRVEGEIALVLGTTLPNPDASDEDVGRAVVSVHAAIEICDTRIAGWKLTLADTVADNGSAGYFAISKQGCAPDGLDLYSCGMVLEVDGMIAALGAGAAAFGHPIRALGWLARDLARRGDPLQAGDIVLTGTLGVPVAVTQGSRITVTIGGIGSCTIHYG